MTALPTLPLITVCHVTECSFNHDGCHAPAVTIGGNGSGAQCATYVPLSIEAGVPGASAEVGACQRTECVFNKALLCTADAVQIGTSPTAADCLTYAAA